MDLLLCSIEKFPLSSACYTNHRAPEPETILLDLPFLCLGVATHTFIFNLEDPLYWTLAPVNVISIRYI
jgi:hypothetical protein